MGPSVPPCLGYILACDRPMTHGNRSGLPENLLDVYNDRYSTKHRTNLIVAWDVVYQALEVVAIPTTVPHCPVEVGFDALS